MNLLNTFGVLFLAWLSAPYLLWIVVWLLELHGTAVVPKPRENADSWLWWVFNFAAAHPIKHGVAWMVSLIASVV